MTNLGEHVIGVLKRPTSTDDGFGNPTYAWATVDPVLVYGCSVQPVEGDEQTVGRDTVVSRWRVWAPDGTDLTAVDRVRWQGDDYEIDGEVQRWDFAPLSHVTALMRRAS